MGLRHIAPLIDNDNRKAVQAATFGHLFPKSRFFRGHITIACTLYEGNVILREDIDVDGSPWWYASIHDFIHTYDLRPGQVIGVEIAVVVLDHIEHWDEWCHMVDGVIADDVELAEPKNVSHSISVYPIGTPVAVV